ncbi:histidine phosphatase family protein [Dethiobacter alkaliphilus]|uniref:histidine phosphatase family protein n=1 Tax=Dethiobacter alkaliphilus TaxID=427926 RepID=UPI00222767C1|nr:histidine phosphatase family protein [Dethiobacter alkaliphilus]MCW3488941.1 histidine phosphatase family protein [Dethiobacter alkaliphilus]
MQILLARHGQTTANAEKRFQGQIDCPLNSTGQNQARRLAGLLAQFEPGRIFTSDLSRSIHTARPAAELLTLEPVVSPVFREYSWGVLEGLTWPEIKERYPALFSELRTDLRRVNIPGQEPLESFRQRLQQGLKLLLDEGNPRTVALVGHGRYLNALVVEFLGLDFAGPWPFSFSSAAVTVLEERGGRRRLIRFNEECHLMGETNA